MKKLLSQVGFTLIELLVVISVIGVLAVAVLSSINPIEQINKGRDTGARSDAAQLINAVDRYYATQELFPWNNTHTACGADPATGAQLDCNPALTVSPVVAPETDPATEFPDQAGAKYTQVCLPGAVAPGIGLCKTDGSDISQGGGGWLFGLANTSEVKPAFVSRLQALTTYAIYVYKGPGADAAMFACFRPSSKAFQTEALDKGCRDINVVTGWGGPASVVAVAACPSTTAGAAGSGTGIGDPGYPQSVNHDELICLP
jgi:prepilin-type N-terminal cleavage/methylation domain-containing protein